jgi:hypothetical protein
VVVVPFHSWYLISGCVVVDRGPCVVLDHWCLVVDPGSCVILKSCCVLMDRGPCVVLDQ